MKYHFTVETAFIKEIEIEAANEQEAYDKAYEAAYSVTFEPSDEAGYDREINLLDD